MVDAAWIADACAEAHRLRHSPEAARILAYVERRVLGAPTCTICGGALPRSASRYCSEPCRVEGRREWKRLYARDCRAARCSVDGCENERGRLQRFCAEHRAMLRNGTLTRGAA